MPSGGAASPRNTEAIWTKYNAELSYGTVDNKTVLDADDDVDPIQRFPR